MTGGERPAPGPREPRRSGAGRLLLSALWIALPLGALVTPRPAHATAEEFSTFDVESQEEDDESVLDHLLTRMPRAWRDEWEHAPQAFRTSQGCLTSGQWFIFDQLKLRAPLGRRSTFDLGLLQSHDDTEAFEALELAFHRSLPSGAVGLVFAPNYDKSKQDFSLEWRYGADTTALEIETRITLEDTFNNLWEFRQSRAGQASEPYLRHPLEPGIRVVSRHERVRLEVGGRWLTPNTKKLEGLYGQPPFRIRTLWGALGYATVELRALGLEWGAGGRNEQATSSEYPDSVSNLDFRDFRRQWSAELSARRTFSPRVSALAHFFYQERTQRYGADVGPGVFAAVDRVTHVEVDSRLTPTLMLRVGGFYDRLGFARSGRTLLASEDRKKESRAFIGLIARFGRVSVAGVEGIELDREPYDVAFHHDKGFLQLQTTF